MSKKLIIGILIIFCLAGIGGWLYFSQPKELPSTDTGYIFPEQAEKFSISGGGGYPSFVKELIIYPFQVKEGEKQYYSIWVKDPEGIEKVTAVVKTDKDDKIFNLELKEGTEKEGKWEGFWLTENISLNTRYSTEFRAINKNGEDTKSISFWYRREN